MNEKKWEPERSSSKAFSSASPSLIQRNHTILMTAICKIAKTAGIFAAISKAIIGARLNRHLRQSAAELALGKTVFLHLALYSLQVCLPTICVVILVKVIAWWVYALTVKSNTAIQSIVPYLDIVTAAKVEAPVSIATGFARCHLLILLFVKKIIIVYLNFHPVANKWIVVADCVNADACLNTRWECNGCDDWFEELHFQVRYCISDDEYKDRSRVLSLEVMSVWWWWCRVMDVLFWSGELWAFYTLLLRL